MRNDMTLDAICRELESNCGDELAACKSVGVSLGFLNQWRKDDKATDSRVVEAMRVGVQGLYSAAVRRAVNGVPKNVYFKGEKVDTETVYSDGLLQTLLKAKLDDFKADSDGSRVSVNVNVANLMPRATSYDQWLEMKQSTLNAPSDAAIAAARLMAPSDGVIEAEYVEITPEPAFAGIEL